MLLVTIYCIVVFVFKLTYPESKKNFNEIDDFVYDVIYQKELGENTPKKLLSSWRTGYNILSVRTEENDLLVATGMLQKPKRSIDTLQLEHIAVDPNYRQQKLGSLVVVTLVDYAKQSGAKRVKLKSLQEAVEFYKRCGFSEYDKTMHFMERKIS